MVRHSLGRAQADVYGLSTQLTCKCDYRPRPGALLFYTCTKGHLNTGFPMSFGLDVLVLPVL